MAGGMVAQEVDIEEGRTSSPTIHRFCYGSSGRTSPFYVVFHGHDQLVENISYPSVFKNKICTGIFS